MTLSLYIARRFVAIFLIVFAAFFGIMLLLDMIEQIRRFGSETFGVASALRLSLLSVPESIYRILPLVTILAAIGLFIALARSSELVVMRATGRSALRTLVAPVAATLAIGVLSVAVLNPIVAATSKRYDTETNRLRLGDGNVLSVSGEGVWLRQGGAEGQSVIRAERSNQDATELFGVTLIEFRRDGTPAARIEAETARLAAGGWVLTKAKQWNFEPGTNAETTARSFDELTVPSDLTPEQIRDSFGEPSAIPIWELPSFIDGLKRAGYSARRHQVWFQTELALPLLLASMVLIGAGFTMRHTRFGRTGLMVLFAILSGFAIFFLRNFAQLLGESGQIPVVLAAWSPPLTATLASLALLLHLEDG